MKKKKHINQDDPKEDSSPSVRKEHPLVKKESYAPAKKESHIPAPKETRPPALRNPLPPVKRDVQSPAIKSPAPIKKLSGQLSKSIKKRSNGKGPVK